jgi:ubiquinone/menaquinone biosynthesis C-methylase UbiE
MKPLRAQEIGDFATMLTGGRGRGQAERPTKTPGRKWPLPLDYCASRLARDQAGWPKGMKNMALRVKDDIQKFWGSLYESLYAGVNDDLDRETLCAQIADLKAMFQYRAHMAVVEMPISQLAGKQVLEIGSGAGGHSALFAAHGAHMTSIDVTFVRAKATQHKFDVLGTSANCRALQADAELLPFADDSFDFVYSNGVLHHTPDTQSSIDQVLRVLKPGGRAVIMLYCKSSWHYWFNMWFCQGILLGKSFRDANWLGKATEWGGRNRQEVLNPITKCYTRRGIRRLFHRFADVRLRKGEFYFYLIPKLGRFIRYQQLKRYGTHPGGLLVYGTPWPVQSPLELQLGRVMGFGWFISAVKPPGPE